MGPPPAPPLGERKGGTSTGSIPVRRNFLGAWALVAPVGGARGRQACSSQRRVSHAHCVGSGAARSRWQRGRCGCGGGAGALAAGALFALLFSLATGASAGALAHKTTSQLHR